MVFESRPLFDSTYSKHGGNAESIAANLKAHKSKQTWRHRVFTLMAYREQAGFTGTTLMDACRSFNKERGQLSGRFTDLSRAGMIERTGRVLDGFAEYKIATIESRST
jgi:hypothetical protein